MVIYNTYIYISFKYVDISGGVKTEWNSHQYKKKY